MKYYYISDLHLDYKDEAEKQKFYDLLIKNKDDAKFIINGDFANDYRKTLRFVKEIDKLGIKGYWTLGNHEFFWLAERSNVTPLDKTKFKNAKPQTSAAWDKFLSLIASKTKTLKNFKFLDCGQIVNLEKDWYLIGDVGWSSFSTPEHKLTENELSKFEWGTKFKQWNFEWIKKQNKKWISFANSVINNIKYKNIVVATHYPMYFYDEFSPESRFSKKEKLERTYWFSDQRINNKKNKNVLFIHGHTHDISYAKGHVTNAIGRRENSKTLELMELKLK